MNYNFSPLKAKLAEVEEWLSKELGGLHTGRATPALLDGVFVELYGARTLVAHVASITLEGPKALRITPWDKAYVKQIERAITVANLGVSVSSDDQGVRVSFPDLTAERRKLLGKLIREKHEDARVSVRSEREKVWNDIQQQEKDKKISEDKKFTLKDELQKIVDDANKKLDDFVERKIAEIEGK